MVKDKDKYHYKIFEDKENERIETNPKVLRASDLNIDLAKKEEAFTNINKSTSPNYLGSQKTRSFSQNTIINHG